LSNAKLLTVVGSITSGAGICQYKKKSHDKQNQQWALSPEGIIFPQSNKNLVLTVKENETVRSSLYLSERRAAGHKEQSWNFVLPVFKKKTSEYYNFSLVIFLKLTHYYLISYCH
jgi:hypothetical protein